jgi:hypothetical protein
MKTEQRKAAIAAYKKGAPAAGIYAIRCPASGQVWVGRTLNADTMQNRLWFTLRQGSHANPELQSAWSTHGGEAFSFELLERLKDEELDYVRDALLKERMAVWRSALQGSAI